MNVVDWSVKNNLVVALANSVYIWNYSSNKVNKLTQFSDLDLATGITWDLNSESLIIGTLEGKVEYWDVESGKLVMNYCDHNERVSAVSLVDDYLLTGSRDK